MARVAVISLAVSLGSLLWPTKLEPKKILSGECNGCVYERVVIKNYGQVTTTHVASIGLTRRRMTANEVLARLPKPRAGDQFVIDALVLRAGQSNFSVSPDDLGRLSCRAELTLECLNAKAADWREISIGFTFITSDGNLPMNNYGREYNTPGLLSASKFSLAIHSDKKLFTEGDIEQVSQNEWRYVAKGFGYLAYSTQGDFKEFAAAYLDQEFKSIDNSMESVEPAMVRETNADVAASKAWSWLRENIQYEDVGLWYSDNGGQMRVSDILQRGRTDCKGLALLMKLLLKRQGVDAHTVLVQTHKRRQQSKSSLPTGRFNHVVVYVPSLDRYLDPTLISESTVPTGGNQRFVASLDTTTSVLSSINSERTY